MLLLVVIVFLAARWYGIAFDAGEIVVGIAVGDDLVVNGGMGLQARASGLRSYSRWLNIAFQDLDSVLQDHELTVHLVYLALDRPLEFIKALCQLLDRVVQPSN